MKQSFATIENIGNADSQDVSEVVNLHKELVSGMVEFMAFVGIEKIHLNPLNAAIIAESVHRPEFGFWRSFRTSMIVDAFDCHMPDWRQLPPNKLMGFTTHQFVRELERQVRINAFDEANVAFFFTLPEAHRPVDSDSAYQRICWHVEYFGSLDDCRQLEESGTSAGRRAYDLYQYLEAAQRREFRLTSLGAEVKRCRDAANARKRPRRGRARR